MPLILAGVGAVMLALGFLLLFVIAVPILSRLLQSVLSQIPYVGGWLGNAAVNGANLFIRTTAPIAAATFDALAEMIDWLTWAGGSFLGHTRDVAQALAWTAVRLVTVVLPHELGLLRADLGNWITAVNQFTWQVYAQVENDFKAALGSATAALNAAIAAVNQFTWQVYAQVENDLNAARDLLTARIAAAVGAEQARAIAAERTVEGHADQLFNQAIAVGAAAEAALRNDLGAEAAALGRAINSGVRGLENELTSSNAATAATIGTLGAVVAREIEAIKDSPCMRQCEPLGQLGADLGGLDILMLFGLVAAAVHDPEATAQAVDRFASPIITELEQVARGAVGFKA